MEEIAECVPSDVSWVQAHLGDVILHLLSFIVICHLQNERNVIGKVKKMKSIGKGINVKCHCNTQLLVTTIYYYKECCSCIIFFYHVA